MRRIAVIFLIAEEYVATIVIHCLLVRLQVLFVQLFYEFIYAYVFFLLVDLIAYREKDIVVHGGHEQFFLIALFCVQLSSRAEENRRIIEGVSDSLSRFVKQEPLYHAW